MKTHKSILIFFILHSTFFVQQSFAQQIPIASQYMFNDLVINPAIAGSKEYLVARLTHRNQWSGIKGSPVTQTLSAHLPLEGSSIGVGGFLFNDMLGPFRKTGLEGDFAFHIPMGDAKLSLGLQLGVFQFHFNPDEVTTTTPDDKVITESSESKIMPDASFGAYFYSEKYFVGISTPQLIEVKFKLSTSEREKIGRLARHYILYGGYKFEVNENFAVEPSLLLRTELIAPLSIDINAKAIFMNAVFVGASYRTNDAIVALIGFKINEKFHFGYSYDITLSDLKSYNKGSHELMVGYDFNDNSSGYGRGGRGSRGYKGGHKRRGGRRR